jgi:hypothetical protein
MSRARVAGSGRVGVSGMYRLEKASQPETKYPTRPDPTDPTDPLGEGTRWECFLGDSCGIPQDQVTAGLVTRAGAPKSWGSSAATGGRFFEGTPIHRLSGATCAQKPRVFGGSYQDLVR